MNLWVRFPSRLLNDPVVQRQRRLVDVQETMVQFRPGSLVWSVGVLVAHLLGKEEDRVQVPDGPLMIRAAGPTGRRLPCKQEIGVQLPGGPLSSIRKVAGYGWPDRGANAALAWRDEGSTPLPSAVKKGCGARDECNEALDSLHLIPHTSPLRRCLWCSGFCTTGCEPGGGGSTPSRHPSYKEKKSWSLTFCNAPR